MLMFIGTINESNEYSKEVQNQMKNPNFPLMINNICSFKPRINLIVKLVIDCVVEGRKILLLVIEKTVSILKEEFDNYKVKTSPICRRFHKWILSWWNETRTT